MHRFKKAHSGYVSVGLLSSGLAVFVWLTCASVAWAEPPAQDPTAKTGPGTPEVLSWNRSGVRGVAAAKKKRKKKVRGRKGLYLTLGTGLLAMDSAPPPYAQIDEGGGLSVALGYRPSKHFSFEGTAWTGIQDATKLTTNGGATSPTTGTLLGLMGDFKLWFPISPPRVEGYAQLGLGYMSFGAEQTPNNVVAGENTFDGAAFDIGAGLDIRFSKQVSGGVRAQYIGVLTTEQVSQRVGDTKDVVVDIFALFLTASFELD